MSTEAQIDWLAGQRAPRRERKDPARRMVHRHPKATEVAAAERIEGRLSVLQATVLHAFQTRGAMTDEQLETLDVFAQYGPSTIRKRRSELFAMGKLQIVGEATNTRGQRMKIWRAA